MQLPVFRSVPSARAFYSNMGGGLFWLLASVLLGCGPKQAAVQRCPDDFTRQPPRASGGEPAAHLESPSSGPAATSRGDAEAPCGLPEEIRGRDWPRRLAPTLRAEPLPFVEGSFTIAVLPDTQYYALCRRPHLFNQASWLSQQVESRNIAATLHLGDITESNAPKEWEFIVDNLLPLTQAMPLLLSTGNHDHGKLGAARIRSSYFQQYFAVPPVKTARVLRETLRPGDLENAYYRLQAGRATIGVLVLEWSPRGKTVEWANRVVASHPEDRVILVTHAYLYHDDTRYDWKNRGVAQKWNPHVYGTARLPHAAEDDYSPNAEGSYDGEMLWSDLVSRHENIFLTVSGHVLGDGTGLLSSTTKHGNVVHQVLVNYQMLDEGGLGYIRLMEFLPDGKTLRMKTYSPSLDAYAMAKDQRFDLAIVPPLW